MTALPKRRRSKSRQGMLTSHYRLAHVGRGLCPKCHTVKLPHRVCQSCGFYKGRDILQHEASPDERQD